jgi:hypothetical protein
MIDFMPYKDPEKLREAARKSSLAYYYKNKDQVKRNALKSKKRRKELLNGLKRKPCMDCGGEFPPVCMHFHHRDPKEKLFEIADKLTCSIIKLMEEISKCDLICANCHAIREWI